MYRGGRKVQIGFASFVNKNLIRTMYWGRSEAPERIYVLGKRVAQERIRISFEWGLNKECTGGGVGPKIRLTSALNKNGIMHVHWRRKGCARQDLYQF